MKLTRPQWKLPARMHVRITARHWHYAALVVLCLINLALAVRLVYAWRRAEAGNAARLQEREAEYRAMQLKTRPLRGLGKKIARANADQTAFYDKRFPATDSEFLRELGALAVKNNVLLGRAQYGHGKLEQGTYKVTMDASLSGDYAPIVRFLNGLERDRIFFLIEGIALSGQQNGIVSLRVRLTTYLRADGNASAVPASISGANNGRAPATERR